MSKIKKVDNVFITTNCTREAVLYHGDDFQLINENTWLSLNDKKSKEYKFWLSRLNENQSLMQILLKRLREDFGYQPTEPELEYEWVISEDIQVIELSNYKIENNKLFTQVTEKPAILQENTILEIRDKTGVCLLMENESTSEATFYYAESGIPFEIPSQFVRQQIKEEE